MRTISVLVTSAGVMSAVNVIKSLRLQNELDIKIITIDIDEYAPGLYLADKRYLCPPIKSEEKYFNFIVEVIKKENIHYIYPCYSREISFFSKHLKEFQDLGARFLLPKPKNIDLCNDKVLSNRLVKGLHIPVPEIIENPTENDLPIFSKMIEGSGSKGAVKISDKSHLDRLLNKESNRIVQEYIEGIEYTVDTLCDENSDVLVACPRIRLSTKSGQTVKGITVHDSKIHEYTKDICKSLGVIGVCNLQFIKRDNSYYFIELNPRYAAGGLMLTVKSGVNLPLLALKIMEKITIQQSELKHKAGVKMTRYWEEIIIEETE